MEPPLDLIIYGTFENKVLLRLDLLEMEKLEDTLRLWDVIVHLNLFVSGGRKNP
jgi:hypothetical protein